MPRKVKPRAMPKIGRNEPCWCGSGKKYKHCHMRLDASGATQPGQENAGSDNGDDSESGDDKGGISLV
jgi:hypothetical protein